jgi:TolB-like protein
MSLFGELKRRNVLRVGGAYVVTAWLVVQVVETLFPLYGLSDAAARIVVNFLAIGLIPVLVLAWVFEWTPEGLKRDAEVDAQTPSSVAAAKRLDRIILVVLALALGYFAFDKFVLQLARDVELAELARQEGRSEAIIESFGDASIAVLAFENMSSDSEQEFFADGISEEILNLLATVPELRVISRSSAFTYKDREVPIPQIARELNVAHVLEGSVRKAGDRIRVTAQLIEGGTDTHLWSQTWDRTLDDVFAIQDEIAADVVSQLQVSLVGELPTTLRTDPEVYALTLQARQLAEAVEASSGLTRINDLLMRALSIDANYVPALEAKILVENRMLSSGLMSKEEVDQRWLEDRSRILAVDPNNGVVASYDAWDLYQEQRDIEAAAAIYESLLLSHPNDAEVLRVVGGFLRRIGFFEQSTAVLKRCVLVDPLKHGCTWQLKEEYLWSGKLGQSRTYADRLNTFWGRAAGSNDIYRLLLEGQPAEAWDLAYTMSDTVSREVLLALAAHDLGEQKAYEKHLEEALAGEPGVSPRSWSLLTIAGMYAYIGDLDQAFAYLDEATADKESTAYKELMSPWFVPLHEDPRWTAHRQRLGLSEARLAAIEFSVPESFLQAP